MMRLSQQADLSFERLDAQVLVAPFFLEENPLCGVCALLDQHLGGMLTDLLQAGRVSGRFGEYVLAAGRCKLHAPWILFVGAGARADFHKSSCAELFDDVLRICRLAGFFQVGLCFDPTQDITPEFLEAQVQKQCRDPGGKEITCCIAYDSATLAEKN